MTMRELFVPMLDGERLQKTATGFVHADGRPIDPTRLADVVYVNAEDAQPETESSGWWNSVSVSDLDLKLAGEGGSTTALFTQVSLSPGAQLDNASLSSDDVSGLLRTVATGYDPEPEVHFDAAFFHRTFSRWMGIETSLPNDDDDAAPHWDYDFWKAELVEESCVHDDETQHNRHQFLVEIHRGENAPTEQYRYWIDLDDEGFLQNSGWLTTPPDLLVEEDYEGTGFQSEGPDLEMLKELLAQADS
jgi:hypothetical protein